MFHTYAIITLHTRHSIAAAEKAALKKKRGQKSCVYAINSIPGSTHGRRGSLM